MKIRYRTSLALFFLMVPLLFVSLTIYNSRGCDQLVIDSYEVHGSIDIPEIISADCQFDESNQVRITTFKLRNSLKSKSFRKINAGDAFKELKAIHLLDTRHIPDDQQVLIHTGKSYTNEFTFIYDPASKMLIAEIRY